MSWPRSRDLRILDEAHYDALSTYMSLHDEVLGALCKHQATYLDKRFRFTQPSGNPNRTYKVVNLDSNQMIPLNNKSVTGISTSAGHTTEFLSIIWCPSPFPKFPLVLPCPAIWVLSNRRLRLVPENMSIDIRTAFSSHRQFPAERAN